MSQKQGRAGASLGQSSGGRERNPAEPIAIAAGQQLREGLDHHKAGRLTEAEACYRRALALQPGHADALYLLGIVASQAGKPEAALDLIEQAIERNARSAIYFFERARALKALRRFDEAMASCKQALALQPDFADVFILRGTLELDTRRHAQALKSFDRALALRPTDAQALNNRGIALREMNRFEEALASFERALVLRPSYAEALNNHGLGLKEMGRLGEALASIDRALALNPAYAKALNNRGIVLRELKRLDEALASFNQALALSPDDPQALSNRGSVLQELERFEEALESFKKALERDPEYADAALGLIWCANVLCDWDGRTSPGGAVLAQVAERKSLTAPFVLLGHTGDPQLQLRSAKNYVAGTFPVLPAPLWTGARWTRDKVRLAYLSADFRQHPVGYLTAELFERHDRSRFEVIAASLGEDDGSDLRRRLVAAFDRFIDLRSLNDREAARLLHELQIDIVIDLNGYTQDSRPGILAWRPAPIQVNYLGYPATMGAPFIDYILADRVVAPFEHQPFYTEKIVHLPDSFQVNDARRSETAATPMRQEVGLPDAGFVFCCFNQSYKITPDLFDVWMRLLHAVPGSVLWLAHDRTMEALRRQAQRRGVDPLRLVFADRVPRHEDHLARYRLADLFLDTLPYNAHTTASDALWMGLPVLTQIGESFAGRVAASLLDAIGLPELVTRNLGDYEKLALRLANDPDLLAEYRQRLTANRKTHALFDTDRFRRHIEAAYLRMWEIWQRGEPARSFAVEAETACPTSR